jgi:hypothetical protein
MTLVMLAQGVVFGLIFTGGGETADSGGSGWIKATLMLVLGVLLLISAFRSFTSEPDPDAPPPKWMTLIETASPIMALALGAGMILISAKMWVFTMSAISGIGDARLGQPDSSITYLLYVLLVMSTLIIPILFQLFFPARATALLGSLGDWLASHNRQIMIVVSLVFGLLFLYQGVSGLLS